MRPQHWLDRLLIYLAGQDVRVPPGVRIEWDAEQNDLNRTDPRAFCGVERHDGTIFCSYALRQVTPEVQVGILLHELGHIIIGGRGARDIEEVEVDAWIQEKFPEAGYTYAPQHTYLSPWTDEPVSAVNIQTVSKEFVRLIDHG